MPVVPSSIIYIKPLRPISIKASDVLASILHDQVLMPTYSMLLIYAVMPIGEPQTRIRNLVSGDMDLFLRSVISTKHWRRLSPTLLGRGSELLYGVVGRRSAIRPPYCLAPEPSRLLFRFQFRLIATHNHNTAQMPHASYLQRCWYKESPRGSFYALLLFIRSTIR